jgi:hypothetical protein
VSDKSYGFSAYRFAAQRVPPPKLVRRIPLAPGDAGVEQTIPFMRQTVLDSRADSRWHDLAIRLVPLGTALLGDQAYAQLMGNLRGAFRYVRDARGTEQVWLADVHADRLSRLGVTWGDCDDAAIVAAALAQTLNLGAVRFNTIANGKRGPDLNHVFAEVLMDDRWRTLDFLSPASQGQAIRSRVWVI